MSPNADAFLGALRVIASALPGTLAGAVAGYYGGRLAEKAKRGDRIKEEHLAELKSELIQILLTRIDQYYLPIAKSKATALEVSVIQVNRMDSSIAQNRYVRSEDQLSVIPIRSRDGEPIFQGPRVRAHAPAFDRLYEDAKKVHFRGILEAFEEMDSEFETLTRAHLEHAETIAKALGPILPFPAEMGSNFNEPYANIARLALFIYEHQLGVHPYHLWINPNNPLEICSSSTGTRFVRCATAADAAAKLKEVEAVSESVRKRTKALTPASSLMTNLEAVRARLDAAFNSSELPASCTYC